MESLGQRFQNNVLLFRFVNVQSLLGSYGNVQTNWTQVGLDLIIKGRHTHPGEGRKGPGQEVLRGKKRGLGGVGVTDTGDLQKP